MIRGFRHKGLAELFENGLSPMISHNLHTMAIRKLDALEQTDVLSELNVHGFDFHRLQGMPNRYSIHINGPWVITFEWEDGDALRVDLEQYHRGLR